MSLKLYNASNLLEVFKLREKNILITDTINKRKITYEQFLNFSSNTLNKLKTEKKIKPGDKVLISMENSVEFLILIFACLLGGYVAVPIDPNLPKDRYDNFKKMIKPKIAIKKIKIKKNIKKIKEKLSTSKKPFLILFTSGTTGEPKGILLENNKYISAAFSYARMCEYDFNSKIYHCLPMFYNAGMINIFFAGLAAGSNIVIGPRVNSLNLFSLIDNLKLNRINSIHLTPEIFNTLNKIYENRNFEKEELKNIQIISTASYLHEETRENFENKFGARILNCYGITEVGGPLTLQKWENTYFENSVGQHAKEIKFLIYKRKKMNKIFVKSPYIMMGYILPNGRFEKPKLNKNYYDTGDIGNYENGQLFITGRRQDIIKKGGEILSLNLLDNICKKIKNVDDCVHLNLEDIDKGNKIMLFVKFKKIEKIDIELEKLNLDLKKELRNIELPDKIYPVPLIPKLFNGKINKSLLKEIYLI